MKRAFSLIELLVVISVIAIIAAIAIPNIANTTEAAKGRATEGAYVGRVIGLTQDGRGEFYVALLSMSEQSSVEFVVPVSDERNISNLSSALADSKRRQIKFTQQRNKMPLIKDVSISE